MGNSSLEYIFASPELTETVRKMNNYNTQYRNTLDCLQTLGGGGGGLQRQSDMICKFSVTHPSVFL